ncbi:CMRF35-like molecule 6 isoform X3 [Nerophis ophidion]|uniref:CMRF35-like molecule 6 isoform X3 n=1 Tax=Nerophis ophidion TaxID=159077 RepID=UPI002ADFD71C|nr:CMRF35-like molecule 6 isoform X3 [Nerophis ophidion]XP_061736539.1 CMRF35-like molecule 6 isoform X3 [Nerophis ophidion]
MDIFFLFFAFLIGGLKAETMSVTGVSGQNITITCSSKDRDDNNKYFCKDPCMKNYDILISSSVDKDKWDTNKYSIRDEKSIFYVTIFHLKKEDSGTYWCGIDVPWGRDRLEIVVITVKEAITPEREPTKLPEQVHPKTSSSSIVPEKEPTKLPGQVHPKTSSSLMPLFIGASLALIVLVLAVVILIYFRHQKAHICTSSGVPKTTMKVTDTAVSTDQLRTVTAQRQDSSNSIAASSLVNPDCPYYSTIGHNSRRDNSHDPSQPTDVTYSLIRFSATAESPLYGNL